ncbi:MAG: DUF427 domain-containing protein, partial [Pseudomonadota bacterium]
MAHIEIKDAAGIWTVRTPDGVLVESRAAKELHEGSLTPVLYFPRADVAMALLERSESKTHCPHKGDASYFSYVGQSERISDVAWSYESVTKADAKPIEGYIAFYSGKIAV